MMNKIINNIYDSYNHVPYTIKHIKAFYKLQRETFGYIKYYFHDFDKIFMYIFLPFLGIKVIRKIHRKINKHHIEKNISHNDNAIEEALLDWECARFTKPDKPLNAFDIIKKKYINTNLYSILYNHLKNLNKLNKNIKIK